jgi:hypothetical protein
MLFTMTESIVFRRAAAYMQDCGFLEEKRRMADSAIRLVRLVLMADGGSSFGGGKAGLVKPVEEGLQNCALPRGQWLALLVYPVWLNPIHGL